MKTDNHYPIDLEFKNIVKSKKILRIGIFDEFANANKYKIFGVRDIWLYQLYYIIINSISCPVEIDRGT